MFEFLKKKPENVDETFLLRLEKLERRVMRSEAEILELITSHDIIRNKVLRKIQGKRPKDEEEEQENLNNKVLLPEPR